MTVTVCLVCLLAGWLTVRFLFKNRNAGRGKKIICSVLCGILFACIAGAGYFAVYYHAEPVCDDALLSSETAEVREIDEGWFFDGKGTENALIFYPGGKVEAEAYAPLMKRIAEKGTDCFLVKMPLNMAVFGWKKAETIMNEYKYERWYLAGHSLGGSAAALYASKYPEQIEGLIMLAAYPTKKIDDDIAYLSIYGSEDGCLEKDIYESDRQYWPEDAEQHVIENGNHAGFGSYGKQKGDGNALISSAEQQTETAEQIIELIEHQQ